MGRFLHIIISLVIATALTGCWLTPKDIEKTVKTSMQKTFSTEQKFKRYNLIVTDVKVVNNGGNSYKGIASVMYNGKTHSVPVDIVTDGSRVYWEIQPGQMHFITQKKTMKLFY